jgi:type I restriction enzyme S subunit
LKSYKIAIPPLSEQQHIVEELDLLSSIIEKKKTQLNEFDNLAQSLFYEMFGDPITNEKGWDVKKIGEIGYDERGAGISKKDFVDDGLPCIHYGQLHTILGPTTYKNKTFIPSNLLSKYKIAHPGDVIMAITSEDVEGSCKSTAWLGNFDVVVGSDAAIFHHSINGVYISYYTMTKSFYNEKAKYANGFKVTHISTKEIESIPIPLPPLDLQDKFANSIKSIEHQKELIKQSIKEVESLFNSRMDYYFN